MILPCRATLVGRGRGCWPHPQRSDAVPLHCNGWLAVRVSLTNEAVIRVPTWRQRGTAAPAGSRDLIHTRPARGGVRIAAGSVADNEAALHRSALPGQRPRSAGAPFVSATTAVRARGGPAAGAPGPASVARAGPGSCP